MIKSPARISLVLIAMFLLLCSLGTGCATNNEFDRNLQAITKPYQFSIVGWEINAFGEGVGKAFCNHQDEDGASISKVTQYFANVEQMNRLESEIDEIRAGKEQGDSASLEAELNKLQQQNAATADTVERIIETQIRETLSQQGIFNPISQYVRLKAGFPPVDFKLGKPPHLLVVSPRDRIESLREITLLPDMSLADMENIENNADKLGVSSLVVELGGIATYPSFITARGDLRFTIETAVHEWLHEYLAFKPLGLLYLLDSVGIYQNYDIATINETLVGIVSKEIGNMVYTDYYVQNEMENHEPEATGTEFDFNKEMREIRTAVDNYLGQGKIQQAEEFMEQKQQHLATKGYYIRKLNQAYFAFYGTYADSPTSISPIGVELTELRSRSASLKDFLERVAGMTSLQDLADSIRQ